MNTILFTEHYTKQEEIELIRYMNTDLYDFVSYVSSNYPQELPEYIADMENETAIANNYNKTVYQRIYEFTIIEYKNHIIKHWNLIQEKKNNREAYKEILTETTCHKHMADIILDYLDYDIRSTIVFNDYNGTENRSALKNLVLMRDQNIYCYFHCKSLFSLLSISRLNKTSSISTFDRIVVYDIDTDMYADEIYQHFIKPSQQKSRLLTCLDKYSKYQFKQDLIDHKKKNIPFVFDTK